MSFLAPSAKTPAPRSAHHVARDIARRSARVPQVGGYRFRRLGWTAPRAPIVSARIVALAVAAVSACGAFASLALSL